MVDNDGILGKKIGQRMKPTGGMTGCLSKPVPIGFGLPLRGFLKSHRPLLSYYHFFILLSTHLPHCICPSIGLANHLRVAPYLVGRRG
jgi:hypothetical protein